MSPRDWISWAVEEHAPEPRADAVAKRERAADADGSEPHMSVPHKLIPRKHRAKDVHPAA